MGAEVACDPPGKCVHESIKLGIGHSAVDIAISFGQLPGEVVRTKEDLKGPSASNQPGEARHGSATWHRTHAYFGLADQRLFDAGKPDVACQDEFAAGSSRTASDLCNRHDGDAAEPGKDIDPRMHASRTVRHVEG